MQNPIVQQVVETLRGANNVLITVKKDPSVDELTAAIALTLILNHMNKHATTVFSGEVPPAIEFLQPDMAIEKNTDSLRDFIIALDKNKADKLRYKVEDDVVRIFITPYQSPITKDDLEFSQGDFNIDVVVTLGVVKRDDFDEAIVNQGRILHDAKVVSLAYGDEATEVGVINWQEQQASGVSEMVAKIGELLGKDVIDSQIATALLTGVVAQTDRFKNDKTTPQVLHMSSALMTAGANQQLIAQELEKVLRGHDATQLAATNTDDALLGSAAEDGSSEDAPLLPTFEGDVASQQPQDKVEAEPADSNDSESQTEGGDSDSETATPVTEDNDTAQLNESQSPSTDADATDDDTSSDRESSNRTFIKKREHGVSPMNSNSFLVSPHKEPSGLFAGRPEDAQVSSESEQPAASAPGVPPQDQPDQNQDDDHAAADTDSSEPDTSDDTTTASAPEPSESAESPQSTAEERDNSDEPDQESPDDSSGTLVDLEKAVDSPHVVDGEQPNAPDSNSEIDDYMGSAVIPPPTAESEAPEGLPPVNRDAADTEDPTQDAATEQQTDDSESPEIIGHDQPPVDQEELDDDTSQEDDYDPTTLPAPVFSELDAPQESEDGQSPVTETEEAQVEEGADETVQPVVPEPVEEPSTDQESAEPHDVSVETQEPVPTTETEGDDSVLPPVQPPPSLAPEDPPPLLPEPLAADPEQSGMSVEPPAPAQDAPATPPPIMPTQAPSPSSDTNSQAPQFFEADGSASNPLNS